MKFKPLFIIQIVIISLTFSCADKKSAYPPTIKTKEFVNILSSDVLIKVDDSISLIANFTNENSMVTTPTIIWSSKNTNIVTIDNLGKLKGKSIGQTYICAMYSLFKDSVLVTVSPISTTTPVLNDTVHSILITSSQNMINKGDSVIFIAKIYNRQNSEITTKNVTWVSNDNSILTVSNSGSVKGISNGVATIKATLDGVNSINISVTVDILKLKGQFVSFGGYSVTGGVTISKDLGGNLKIITGSDFTSNLNPDPRFYLSNLQSGSNINTMGLELALVSSNGVNVINVPSNVKITDYKYVVVQCKQFKVTFGSAELK